MAGAAWASAALARLRATGPEGVAEFQRGRLERLLPTDRGLTDLPPMERVDVAERSKSVRAAHPELRIVSTTGSSGTPLRIPTSQWELGVSRVLAHYGHLRSGRRASDPIAHLTIPTNHPQHPLSRVGLFRTHRLDLRRSPDEILRELRYLKAPVLYGFPSTLRLLARRGGARDLGARLVISNGEVLSPEARALIADGFDAEVRDSYGSVELQQIAWECQQGRLHVLPLIHVEVDEATSLEDGSGEILATSLYHRVVPLVRYRLGDRVRLATDTCDCGEEGMTIIRIEGRDDDFVRLPSGRQISARAINSLEDVLGVDQYRIVQVDLTNLEVHVVLADRQESEVETEIVTRISAGLGGEPVTVTIRQRDELPMARSGKRAAFLSWMSDA